MLKIFQLFVDCAQDVSKFGNKASFLRYTRRPHDRSIFKKLDMLHNLAVRFFLILRVWKEVRQPQLGE